MGSTDTRPYILTRTPSFADPLLLLPTPLRLATVDPTQYGPQGSLYPGVHLIAPVNIYLLGMRHPHLVQHQVLPTVNTHPIRPRWLNVSIYSALEQGLGGTQEQGILATESWWWCPGCFSSPCSAGVVPPNLLICRHEHQRERGPLPLHLLSLPCPPPP